MGTIKSNCKEYYALSSIRAQDVMVGTMSTCPLGCSAKAATLRSIFDCVAGLIVLGEPGHWKSNGACLRPANHCFQLTRLILLIL
jgi:hypothetical protein